MNDSFIIKKEEIIEPDCWKELKEYTDARIALGRTGYSIPTDEYLRFSLAHAQARDAVHLPLNKNIITQKLEKMGLTVHCVHSQAADRQTFLTRPDLGRQLNDTSRNFLQNLTKSSCDILIVIGDGLSSKAIHKQAVPLIEKLIPYIEELGMKFGPIILAEQSRVALGDEIAEILNARLVATLIGERPGLSSPDSLGVYMTYKPFRGRLESERNCISNIRPEGLSYEKAAFKLAWLIESAFANDKSGIMLKDQSDDPQYHLTLKPHSHLELELSE